MDSEALVSTRSNCSSWQGQGSPTSLGPGSKNLRPASNMFRRQNKQLLLLELFAQAGVPEHQQPLQIQLCLWWSLPFVLKLSCPQ